MSDHSNVLGALAAALAPFLIQHLGGHGGNPAAQQGGNFGGQAPQGFGGTPQQTGQQFTQQGQFAQQPQGGFATGFGGTPQQPVQQPQQQQVTPDMIQQLITPLVQNEQVKQALTAQMQQMGIQNLPDARPDQMAELYARFQQVEQQARAAGLLNAPAGAPSII